MPLFKFRVIFEEDDAVQRDIEIKPAQSFADLEAAIMSSYNMPATGSGSFYLSNDNWQKGKQLHPSIKKEEPKKATKAKATSLPSLVAYIDDPHQHFVYEFHGTQEFSFLVELVSIGGTEKDSTMYPVVVKSQGASPFKKEEIAAHLAKRKTVLADHKIEEEEEEEMDDDDEKDEPSPFVESADEPDEEELASIEGEEGDIMDGDAIKEEVEEVSGDDSFVAGDDFDPEDLNENIIEDLEEDI
ncbi:MAG TPA: hypothetical protein VE978_19625 [Chitinophagales bacterium]|nr:hypothetical protein [Chitinophagales bacterium]